MKWSCRLGMISCLFSFGLWAQVDPASETSPSLESEGTTGIETIEGDDLGSLDESSPLAPKKPSEVLPPQPVNAAESPEPSETRDTPGEIEPTPTPADLGSQAPESVSQPPPDDVEPATSTVSSAESSEQDTEQGEVSPLRSKRKKEKKTSIVGAYRIHLGAAGVDFKDADVYKEHYGSESLTPSFKVDYFFFDWYATLGVSFQAGMYKDKGHSLNGQGEKVLTEPTELSLFPLQVAGVLAISPFTQKWLSLSGWTGIEYIRFSEIRPDSKDQNGLVRNLKGTRTGTVAGGALHIRIDFLDEASAASMSVLNLHHIYISPYMQMISRASSSDKIHFSRSEIGIFFSFESL